MEEGNKVSQSFALDKGWWFIHPFWLVSSFKHDFQYMQEQALGEDSGEFISSEHQNTHIHPQIYDNVKQLQSTPFLKFHYLKSKIFILSFFYKLSLGLKGFFSDPNNLEQLKSAASLSPCVSQSINRTISWASYFPSFNILKSNYKLKDHNHSLGTEA